ncbi:MAG: hypothetical protein DRN90_04380 [Thermoproteota archaeon]|nr:MAG: hypothetical protein DRN90_04380 [Candidatus Korarchaeota archaeon]
MRVVVIGYGTAGQTASAIAKKRDPKLEIVILERRSYPAYHPCSLPYALSGKIPLEDVIEKSRPPNLELITKAVAKRINLHKKEVEFEREGNKEVIDYDFLVISTGLEPTVPPVEGLDLEGVSLFWTVEDVERLRKRSLEKVVIVGGSATGIEVAAELAALGKEVSIIEMMEQLLPGKLDPPIASLVAQSLTKIGVKVLLKHPLKRVLGKGGEVTGVIAGDKEIEADTVILCTGAKPNIELAKNSGIRIGEKGGIPVDQWMRTGYPNIYAAGDVAEVRDFVTGNPIVTGLASTALVQGRVAGINISGGDVRYEGALCPFIVHFGEFEVGCTGLTSSRAENEGIKHVFGRFRGPDMAKEVPWSSSIVTWLVIDRSGKLLGAQFLGKRGVWGRVIFCTLAIMKGVQLDELERIEFGYHPLISPVIEPISVLSEALRRKYGF